MSVDANMAAPFPSGHNQPQGGNAPIDPTKNVLDLVAAESKFQNSMREAEMRFQNAMREAETRRIADLASQKELFDRTQADMLRIQVASNATLLSGQLDKMTTILSERIGELERFRWEAGGKGSGMNALWGYFIGAGGLVLAVALAFAKYAIPAGGP